MKHLRGKLKRNLSKQALRSDNQSKHPYNRRKTSWLMNRVGQPPWEHQELNGLKCLLTGDPLLTVRSLLLCLLHSGVIFTYRSTAVINTNVSHTKISNESRRKRNWSTWGRSQQFPKLHISGILRQGLLWTGKIQYTELRLSSYELNRTCTPCMSPE